MEKEQWLADVLDQSAHGGWQEGSGVGSEQATTEGRWREHTGHYSRPASRRPAEGSWSVNQLI